MEEGIVDMHNLCTICNNISDYEVCIECIGLLEGTEGQIQSYNFEEELNLMDIAIDRSLDEHPDFLELIEITKEKTLKEQQAKRKAALDYSNRHFDPLLKRVSIKNVCSPSSNQRLQIDIWLLKEIWKRWIKKCHFCQKENKDCIHLTPYEYEFFWRLIPLNKEIRQLVLDFLQLNGFVAVATHCYCCSRFIQSKVKEKIPPRWINKRTVGKYWSDLMIESQNWHQFVQKIRGMGLKTLVIHCRFPNF